MDSAEVKTDRLFAIGVEPDISLLADVSVEIFLRMQEAATAVPFTEAMADLFADGLLGQPALQSIAAGIEQFVVDEEQRRGVPVKMASTVGTLQGVVTQGIKGSPEPNVTVVLTQGGLEVDSMSTGANGEFTFVDVPRGQATVFVESAPANRVNTTVVATATVTADIDLAFILSNVMSIALGAGGNFIMIDSDFQAIFRADPFGQLISEISSVSRGEGPILQSPSQIAVEPDGNLVVTDSFTGSVVRVNPNTGDRIIVSNPGLGVGLGPRFASTSNSNIRAPGITVQADGTIWLAGIVLPANDEARPAVLRVNSDNGDRTIVSDAATGAGPNFETLFDIAVMESTGQLVVSDQSLNAIIVVDPANGNRTILSDMTIGDDPFLEAVLKSTYL
ncbi:hypothetical protein C2W62_42895 [Candidatus Entotheonella serta]|nr:hypothetical protein C2W62_42895 [Candidatus Entotheonella serta]